MRSIMAAAAAVLVGMAAASPASAAGEFSSGNWKGAAHLKGGKFEYCEMWAPYINRWDLLMSIDQAGYFALGLRRGDLDLSGDVLFGFKTALRLQLDNEPVLLRPFSAITPRLWATKFATNLDWVEKLKTAKVLRVNTGRIYRFPLDGVKEALALLHACANKYRNA
jgi:hypothetical protein